MGFERGDVENALILSRNDYEMACEYLLNAESRAEVGTLFNVESQNLGEENSSS